MGGVTTGRPTPTLLGRIKTDGKWSVKELLHQGHNDEIMNPECLELELGIQFVWFVLFSFIGDEIFQLSELVK
jgi:hypothetical protein